MKLPTILLTTLLFCTNLSAQDTSSFFKEIIHKTDVITTQTNKISTLGKLLKLRITQLSDLEAYYQAYLTQMSDIEQKQAERLVLAARNQLDERKKRINAGLTDTTKFKREIELAVQELQQNLSAIRTREVWKDINSRYLGLHDKFKASTKDTSLLDAYWIKRTAIELSQLKAALEDRKLVLAQTIPELTNYCKTTVWEWNISGYKRTIGKKEQKLQQKIQTIDNKLAQTNKSSSKYQRLNKQRQKIALKKRILIAQAQTNNNLITHERLPFSIVLCQKRILYQGTRFSYWGIKRIDPPTKLNPPKQLGGLDIQLETQLNDSMFHDQATIQVTLTRQAVDNLSPQKTTFNWTLQLHDHPDQKQVKIKLTPNSDNAYFQVLNQQNDEIGIYYFGNLEKQQKELQKTLEELLEKD